LNSELLDLICVIRVHPRLNQFPLLSSARFSSPFAPLCGIDIGTQRLQINFSTAIRIHNRPFAQREEAMNFPLPNSSARRTADFAKSSKDSPTDLLIKVTRRRRKNRNLAILGLGLLLVSLLAIPGKLIKSSAHQQKRQEVKTGRMRNSKPAIPTPAAPDVQPNDICTGAIPIALRQSVNGSLSTATNDYTLGCGVGCFTGVGQTVSTAPGRDVVYSFTAPATSNYSFKVFQNTPSDLVLYTSATCPVPGVVAATRASNRNVTLVSEEVNCQALTSGQQVFIFVDENAVGTSTTFRIEVSQCQPETEANDTPGTANPFIFGVEGSINPDTDADFYSLGTTVPNSRVFALIDGSAGIPQDTEDFDLRVTTATDTLEYDDDNGSSAIGSFSGVIGGRALIGPNTYLRVSPFHELIAAPIPNEPYRLYAIVEPVGINPIAACPTQTTAAIDETEPNDSPGTANTSPGGLGYFEGSLDDVSDLDDFYAIDAKAGDLIFASLDLDPCRDNTPFDGDLYLVAPDGVTVLVAGVDGDFDSDTTSGAGDLTSTTPESPAEGIIYRIQTTGTYFLVAEEFSGSGDYLLAISRNGNLGTGPTAAPATISGRITTGDGAPLAGVTMNLGGARSAKVITDSSGNYRFNNIDTDNFYTVTPSLVNYHFGPENQSFSLLANKTDAMFTATRDAVVSGNAIDTADFFVRQHYLDFLGREPDETGFNFWSDQITSCGADAGCIERRTINVSAAYFLSIEFQKTGGLVDGLYRASYGRAPRYAEFMPDTAEVAQGVVVGPTDWAGRLAANKDAFVTAWVQRAEFRTAYDGLSNSAFVDTLIAHAGVGFNGGDEVRAALVSGLNNNTLTRAAALRQVVENEGFVAAKSNRMFVMMEYFGYLRRDPDESGYQFWLNKLNQFDGNFEQAEMVKAFITSGEYRARFER
jgi:hypothetical protein